MTTLERIHISLRKVEGDIVVHIGVDEGDDASSEILETVIHLGERLVDIDVP